MPLNLTFKYNNNGIERICPICGKSFRPKTYNHKYCSDECRKTAEKELQKQYYKKWQAKHEKRYKEDEEYKERWDRAIHESRRKSRKKINARQKKYLEKNREYFAEYYRQYFRQYNEKRKKEREIEEMKEQHVCPVCGSIFTGVRHNKKFCSEKCRQIDYQRKHKDYYNAKSRKVDAVIRAENAELQAKKATVKELIEQDYLQGLSEEEIAAKYDVTVGVVLDVCQALWELQQARKFWDSKNNLYNKSIHQMLEEENPIQVAEKFSIQPAAIRKVAKENDYKIKSRYYYNKLKQ